MLLECLGCRFLQLVGIATGSVQLAQQGGCLVSEGGLDLRKLVEVLAVEDFVKPVGLCFDAAESACLSEEGLESSAREFRCRSWGGSRCEDGAGLAGTESVAFVGECDKDARVELSQLGTELVVGLAAVPNRVLLSPGKHSDGLGKLGILRQWTKDGLTDYLMIRDDGVRRYGAVAYVKPANGELTLRLTKEDVADVDPTALPRSHPVQSLAVGQSRVAPSGHTIRTGTPTRRAYATTSAVPP